MRMSSKCSWLVKQCQYIFCLVYSLCWSFSGCLYPFAQGQGFWSWDLGTGFIIITGPWGYFGLIIGLNYWLWLWHITLHTNESFIGTPCRLVAQYFSCCMLMVRGLHCYPRHISRLGCGLKARRLGSYPGCCLHSYRCPVATYVPCTFIPFANTFWCFNHMQMGGISPGKDLFCDRWLLGLGIL